MKPVLRSWPQSDLYPCLPGVEVVWSFILVVGSSIWTNPIKPPCSLVQLSVFAVNKSLRETLQIRRKEPHSLGRYVAGSGLER